MKYIYIKYKLNRRESIIKDNIGINHEYSKISHNSSLKESYNNDNSCKNTASSKIIKIKPYIENKEITINEEITQFFFDSIHKNYLKNRLLY